ncbi:MAG: hypothetical protein ACI9HU_000680 [Colwellia sp.]
MFKSDHVKRFLDWFEALEVGISKLGKVIRLFVQSTLAFNGVISHHHLFKLSISKNYYNKMSH